MQLLILFLKCKSIMYLVQYNLNCYSPQTMYFRLLRRQVLGRLLLGRPLLGRPLLGRLLLGRPLLGRRSSSWETRPKGGYSQLVYIYIYSVFMCVCKYMCMYIYLYKHHITSPKLYLQSL